MRKEKELKQKGYDLIKIFNDKDEALAYARAMRENGYYARVIEYSDLGIYDYGVWVKKKEGRK